MPEKVTALTINVAVPDDVRVNVLVAVVFTVTVPKLRALALRVKSGVATAVPVPVRATVAVGPVAELLDMVTVPFAAPVTIGSKVTCTVVD